MKELILLIGITGLIFLMAMTVLILGFVKKRRSLKLISLVTFIAFLVLAGWTGYMFVNKSYNRIANSLKPRTGDEIYGALFGEPKFNCVKVLKKQDQVVPKIDYAIWLYFETCPDELKRILLLQSYKSAKISTIDLVDDGPSANKNWFAPANLGDSVFLFKYSKDDYGNEQKIYSSLDSTRAFCIDILD